MFLKTSVMRRFTARVSLVMQRSRRICLLIWTLRKFLSKAKAWDAEMTQSSQKSRFKNNTKSKSLRSRCSTLLRASYVNSRRNSLKTSGLSKTYSTILSLYMWFHSMRRSKMSKPFRPRTSWDVCTSSAFRTSPSSRSLASFVSLANTILITLSCTTT